MNKEKKSIIMNLKSIFLVAFSIFSVHGKAVEENFKKDTTDFI